MMSIFFCCLIEGVGDLGCRHVDCEVDNTVIDKGNKVVTTSVNMLTQNLVELRQGIYKLVKFCKIFVV